MHMRYVSVSYISMPCLAESNITKPMIIYPFPQWVVHLLSSPLDRIANYNVGVLINT